MVQIRQPDGLFLVEIDRFQGPLDLLLHLIREQDIDILDIPIARITKQFLLAVKEIQAMDLDSAGEFLEMAATLVRIKAQLLLPRPTDEGDEDPRAELVRRLLEYEQIREVSQRLERAEGERLRRFCKGFLPARPTRTEDQVPLEVSWEEVFEAALGVEIPEIRDREHRVSPRTVSMEEKVELILERVGEAGRIEFRALVAPFGDRMHEVMTLLAGLELTRRREIRLRQSRPFHELWVFLRELEDGDSVAAPDEEVRT